MSDDHAYAPDVVIARLTPGECVACRFKERRRLPFVDDDTIGSRFDLCFIDFEAAGDNTVSRSAVGAFDAVFSCPGCGPPPPPTATPPPLPRQTPRKKGMSGGAIAAICGATLAGGAAAGAAGLAGWRELARRRAEAAASAFAAVFASDADIELPEVSATRRGRGGVWSRLRDEGGV